MKFSIKKLISFFAMLCLLFSASACTMTNKPVTARYANLTPDSFVFKSSEGFDFIQLNNDCIDAMSEERKDIESLVVYITDNSLDIDGDNEQSQENNQQIELDSVDSKNEKNKVLKSFDEPKIENKLSKEFILNLKCGL